MPGKFFQRPAKQNKVRLLHRTGRAKERWFISSECHRVWLWKGKRFRRYTNEVVSAFRMNFRTSALHVAKGQRLTAECWCCTPRTVDSLS